MMPGRAIRTCSTGRLGSDGLSTPLPAHRRQARHLVCCVGLGPRSWHLLLAVQRLDASHRLAVAGGLRRGCIWCCRCCGWGCDCGLLAAMAVSRAPVRRVCVGCSRDGTILGCAGCLLVGWRQFPVLPRSCWPRCGIWWRGVPLGGARAPAAATLRLHTHQATASHPPTCTGKMAATHGTLRQSLL
jgi:hypothetical protein